MLLEGAVELACWWVMLQGAARRVRTVPNSCCKGASEGCCCTLQGAVVGFFSEAAGGVV